MENGWIVYLFPLNSEEKEILLKDNFIKDGKREGYYTKRVLRESEADYYLNLFKR